MEIKDVLDIMNSDFKLWEKATDENIGNGSVAKTLDLPWGIGKYTVTLEGMNDATKRRGAVAAFGEHIRGVIRERTNDDSITSRAKVAAARVEQSYSGDGAGISDVVRVLDEAVQETYDEDTEEAHEELTTRPVGLREVFTARRVEIIDEQDYFTRRRDSAIDELKALELDLKAVEAGLEALGE